MDSSESPLDPTKRLRRLLDDGIKPRQLLYAAVKLGVFDALRYEAVTGPDLARALGTDPDGLSRALRGLAALEVLAEGADGRFALAPMGALLCRGVPGSLRGEALLIGDRDRAWTGLLEGIRTGCTPFTAANGAVIFDRAAADPDHAAALHAWMAGWSDDFDAVAAACPLPTAGVVVDVGGGRGDLLAALLRREPGLRGVLFDRHSEDAGAAAFLAAAGVAGRCRIEAGDFFATVPPDGDAYVLCRILHDWDDAAAGCILGRVRAAMPPSATLLIVEKLLPEYATDDPGAVFLDLDMLVEIGGRQRSLAGFRKLLADNDFRLDRVVERGVRSAVLIAEPTA